MSAPRHLAIIPDGNRRWARAQGLRAAEGHRAGLRALGPVLESAWASGVEVVSFWWGSPANLKFRDADEVKVIVGALGAWLSGPGARLLAAHGAALEVIGRWGELCPELGPAVADAQVAAGTGPRRFVLLMGYDGRDELRTAANQLRGGGQSTEQFTATLWTGHLPPVDLVIRSGGEPHLSAGFLLWHIAEAQLYFSEALWPAFGVDGLRGALDAYAGVERRFGR